MQHQESRTITDDYTIIFPEVIFSKRESLFVIGVADQKFYLAFTHDGKTHLIESISHAAIFHGERPHEFDSLDEILGFILYHEYGEEYCGAIHKDFYLENGESEALASYVISTMAFLDFDSALNYTLDS